MNTFFKIYVRVYVFFKKNLYLTLTSHPFLYMHVNYIYDELTILELASYYTKIIKIKSDRIFIIIFFKWTGT
jgi:hypothetical protein